MFLLGGSDNIPRVITLTISEFAVLAGIQFLLYAAEGAAPDYFVGSFLFYHVGGGILFRLPTPIRNFLRHFGFYTVAERMRRDPALVVLALYRVTEIEWPISGDSGEFIAYDLATDTVQVYPAEKNAPVKRQKVDDGSVVPAMAPSVDVNWLPGVAPEKLSKVEFDYRRYIGRVDDDASQPAGGAVDVVDDIDIFLRRRHFARGMVGRALQQMTVPLLPQLWQ